MDDLILAANDTAMLKTEKMQLKNQFRIFVVESLDIPSPCSADWEYI